MPEMPILWYFGSALLLYGALNRQERLFLLVQLIWAELFVLFGFGVFRLQSDPLRAVLLWILLAVCGITPLVLVQPRDLRPKKGNPEPLSTRVGIGITDASWLGIIGGAIAFIGFAFRVPPFAAPLPVRGLSPEYYQIQHETAMRLLEITFQSIYVLGGTLAACMTILWSGEIWRARNAEEKREYAFTTKQAIRMVFGFFVSVIAGLVWIGTPLYKRMQALTELLK